MPRQAPTAELVRQIRLQLPRILVVVGIGLFVVGIIATIAFVASDSGCNAITNPTVLNGGQITGTPATGSFCGHEHGFLTFSFLTLVLGAILIGIGSMVLPTLRTRDARLARERAAAPPPPSEPESEPANP
jgi:hypothetical protein